MKYRTRIYYTAEQKAEMWDRWQRGETINSIGQAFDRGHSSISGQFERAGGIRPSPRRRSRLALTLSEREEISRGIAAIVGMQPFPFLCMQVSCGIRSCAGAPG
jgi:hypothetical protein